MTTSANVLFDAPGPKALARHRLIGIITAVVVLALLVGFGWGMRSQYAPEKLAPFADPLTWTSGIIPGLINTLQAAVISILAAGILGVLLGIGRLSDIAPLRWLCTIIVEFFRAVPVLVMMIFTQMFIIYVLRPMGVPLGGAMVSLVAVVTGLTLYNSSVIAELIRSGMHSLPRGQSEAGRAIGLTNSQVRWIILLPQAITAMLPSLVSQLVVVLKDSALGSIVLYPELLRSLYTMASNSGNTIAAMTVGAIIFIVVNYGLTSLAHVVQRKVARRGVGRVVADGAEQPDQMNRIAEDAGIPH